MTLISRFGSPAASFAAPLGAADLAAGALRIFGFVVIVVPLSIGYAVRRVCGEVNHLVHFLNYSVH